MVLAVLAVGSTFASGEVTVTVDAAEVKGDISPMLTGVNMSWYYDIDEIWSDGSMAAALRTIKSRVLRYPGGCETSLFHWEKPYGSDWACGDQAIDFYDPSLDPEDYPPDSRFMDTDDFIVQSRAVGAEPLIGINIQSGIKYNRLQDSVDEAVRWVQYCKDKNYDVTYWYLENEPYYESNVDGEITAADYAGYIRQFGAAMKAVDPDIKIIVAWENKLSVESYWADWELIIKEAGEYIDVADVHWYWAWGYATWDLWLGESPMRVREWAEDLPDQRYIGPSYIEDIRGFYNKIKDIDGVSYDIELAALEWNIAPVGINTFSKFQHALMQAEMLGQFVEGGLHMACIWPLTWTSELNGNFNTVLDQEQHKPTPSLDVFEFYSTMLGQQLIGSSSSEPKVCSVAALSEDGNVLRLTLLHKSGEGETMDARIAVDSFDIGKVEATVLTAANLAGEGFQRSPLDLKLNAETGEIEGTLPPHSLTLVTLRRNASPPAGMAATGLLGRGLATAACVVVGTAITRSKG